MALLWTQAMAWHEHEGLSAQQAGAKPVKEAGFKGYVGDPNRWEYEDDEKSGDDFDDDLYENTAPEPTHHEQRHHDKHGEYPQTYYDRHDDAYAEALERKQAEDEPDLEDGELHHFTIHHGANTSLWQAKGELGHVDISKGVYATQSHVAQFHIDRHMLGPTTSWHEERHGYSSDGDHRYLGHDHPMFVTHEGRLHATEGHHRVAAAIQRGDSRVYGWHYDADKHGFPPEDDD